MATATETYRYSRLRIEKFAVDVPLVIVDQTIYFPIRGFCEAIGIVGPQRQVQRLRTDSRISHDALRDLPIPTSKGLRLTTCLRGERQVTIWLTIIDPARLKPAIRGRLEDFQCELFAAAERFLFGDTSDVVKSEERAVKPIYGVMHLGDCPRCGLALCLTIDETGSHLAPDLSVIEGERE